VNKIRRGHKVLALVAASALVFAACGSDDDNGDSGAGDTTGDTTGDTSGEAAEGAAGGTLIWAHEQEPPDLHVDDPENNLSAASWMLQSMFDGLYGITAKTEFFPELIAGEEVITENDDGSASIDFKLRDGLTWSDGTPLTANDVEFYFNVVMASDGVDEEGEPNFPYLIIDRTGYDTITDFTVNSDTEFTITWSAFYAGYKSIFERIYPSHVFSEDPLEAAAEMNEALRTMTLADGTIVPASGPMIFNSWQKGVQMNLDTNPSYHGSVSPDVSRQGEIAAVDGVQINFVTDTDAQVNALLASEAQIVFTQPQLAFEDLSSNEDFTVSSEPGPTFEHWGLNLNNVHLAKTEVREALAFAMDKAEVMEGLYTPLFGDALPAEGLGNTYWLSNQSNYEDHAGDAGYGAGDIASAQAALEAAGYAQNADGIYEHPEDGVLSLRVGTTGGNRLREIQQELIQAQMKDAGIEIVIDNVEGGAYFGEVPFSADAMACSTSGGSEGNCDIWDITQFAWVGGPWPGGQTSSYRAGGENNPYGFNNADFEARADECDTIVDLTEAAACYNELDTWATTLVNGPNGLFMLPLTQKPSFYGFTSQLSAAAVAPDADDAGPLVNVVDYVFAG
jgi:peptide/nickel transport system substrate-binding protein